MELAFAVIATKLTSFSRAVRGLRCLKMSINVNANRKFLAWLIKTA